MKGREQTPGDDKKGKEPPTALTNLSTEQRLAHLAAKNPERAEELKNARVVLSRLLGKTDRDWNAPSDCLRDGD
jgi:hypothetical protein